MTNRRSFSDHLSTNITVLLILIGSMAGLYVIDNVLPVSLAYWGIIPRDTGSLMHIFTAPFIHGSLGHLVNNLVGLTVFSAICMVRSLRFWLAASVFVITMAILFGQYLTPTQDLVYNALYRFTSVSVSVVLTLLVIYLMHLLLNRFEATRLYIN